MLEDLFTGCGTLVCLIIIGVSLFFAMYFGNAFSIPGVIVLLIIGVVVIIQLVLMLNESQKEATKYQTASKMAETACKKAENESQWLREQLSWQKQENQQPKDRSWCIVM